VTGAKEATMTPIETVQQIYAAFGRGDVPAILERLADDVQWEYATAPNPIPWLQPLSGRDQVPQFFEALAANIEITRFEVTKILGDDSTVVDLVTIEYIARATGRKVQEIDEVHIWHFDVAGRVQRFRHRADTLQQAWSIGKG
jgi:ketosteroid isomerase-like protein